MIVAILHIEEGFGELLTEHAPALTAQISLEVDIEHVLRVKLLAIGQVVPVKYLELWHHWQMHIWLSSVHIELFKRTTSECLKM